MIQRVEHLRAGDLCVILLGWSNRLHIARFIKSKRDRSDSKVISITYQLADDNGVAFGSEQVIYTRHSTQQRIYKITEDNLKRPETNGN